MSFESDFKGFMPHTVAIEPHSGLNRYGEQSFGTSVDFSGLVENRVRMTRDAQGRERVSTTTIYLNATTAITPRDRVTLPSGFEPRQPPILRVDRLSDDQGLHHTVIFC